jgi:hypothetical protein
MEALKKQHADLVKEFNLRESEAMDAWKSDPGGKRAMDLLAVKDEVLDRINAVCAAMRKVATGTDRW